MKAQEARALGAQLSSLVQAGSVLEAYCLLAPVLAQPIPFAVMAHVGEALGDAPLEPANAFLGRVAATRTEGGWVVTGRALGRQLGRDLPGAMARCRGFVAQADVWYGTDILGERVPGPALVFRFEPTLELLSPWRQDPNRWVRRAVGVAVHFWAKRSRGEPEYASRAGALLSFLEPMFEERDLDATKGVGWGLKTLGRYYPGLVAEWLAEQVVQRQRPHRALMLRKALTYLPLDWQPIGLTNREPHPPVYGVFRYRAVPREGEGPPEPPVRRTPGG